MSCIFILYITLRFKDIFSYCVQSIVIYTFITLLLFISYCIFGSSRIFFCLHIYRQKSRSVLILFQHFKNVILLSSESHHFCWEISCLIFPFRCFQEFSLLFVFCNFTLNLFKLRITKLATSVFLKSLDFFSPSLPSLPSYISPMLLIYPCPSFAIWICSLKATTEMFS